MREAARVPKRPTQIPLSPTPLGGRYRSGGELATANFRECFFHALRSFPPKRERSRFLLRGFVASAYRYARMNFRGNRPAFSIRNHQHFPCVAPILTHRLGRAPWATLRPNPRSAPVQAALGCRSRTRFARGIEG